MTASLRRLPEQVRSALYRTLFANRNVLLKEWGGLNVTSIANAHGVTMNAAQCRMARAALQIGVRELAQRAKVSPSTIARLEGGEALKERTVEAVKAALEAAGVAFTNGGEPGVKLTRKD